MVNVNTVVIYCDTRVIYHGILTFENIGTAVNYCGIFKTLAPKANVLKLFTAVINHHFIVTLSFCIIKLYYPWNYCGIAVNFHSILTLEKVELKVLR